MFTIRIWQLSTENKSGRSQVGGSLKVDGTMADATKAAAEAMGKLSAADIAKVCKMEISVPKDVAASGFVL
jgi:hypothetical protein